MAGASVPLEVVGGIMAFVGAGVPATLTFSDHGFLGPHHSPSSPWWGSKKCITAHPAKYELVISTNEDDYSSVPGAAAVNVAKRVTRTVRETWPRTNETAELAKAVVHTWLSSSSYYLLVLERGILKESIEVFSAEFDGTYETFEGQPVEDDGSERRPPYHRRNMTEGERYFEMFEDEPLPKHFARLQQLHQQHREQQLATAHRIASIFFASPTYC